MKKTKTRNVIKMAARIKTLEIRVKSRGHFHWQDKFTGAEFYYLSE